MKTKVLLLFGGESTEHEVSVMSARNVYEAIDHAIFDVSLGFITKQGAWYLLDTFEDFETAAVQLVPLLGQQKFQVGAKTYEPAVILPILHGKNGEDGSVQALAQLLHIPIVGCDMTSSAIGMDKVATKRIASQLGLNIVPYQVYRQGTSMPTYEDIAHDLGTVIFVKPSRAGSSVGVHKVQSADELQSAIQDALRIDDTVLIEQSLPGVRELEVAALGVPPYDEMSRVGEVLPGEEFYSYDDKYSTDSESSIRVPADVPPETAAEIRRQAKLLFTEIGASGISRIDFFMTDDGSIYLNEINTLPGFTDISMYPRLWDIEGLNYTDLITQLIKQTIR